MDKDRIISCGQFRQLCTLEFNSPTLNSKNDEVPNWQPVLNAQGLPFQFWALIQQLTGRELEIAKQYTATADVKITTRYQGASFPITTTQRIAWNGNVYNIGAVINVDNYNQKYVIYATQILTGGFANGG
jgi:SPP1 family predicted phage head-tail adaptor